MYLMGRFAPWHHGNTAAILGVSLGKHAPTLAREDVYDSTEENIPALCSTHCPFLKPTRKL